MEGVPEDKMDKGATTIAQAIKIIVIADITMATDNYARSWRGLHGNLFLLIFGVGLSIPVCCVLQATCSQCYGQISIIIYIGAAVLGKGRRRDDTDPFIVNILKPGKLVIYSVEAVLPLVS